MLLRRITEHVKTQNWFAVGIDFLIVVMGVFIGLQVANLNDARREHESDRQALSLLVRDIDLMIDATERDIEASEQMFSGLMIATHAMESCSATKEEADIISGAIYDVRYPRWPNMYRYGLDDLSNSDTLARIGNAEFTQHVGMLGEDMEFMEKSFGNYDRELNEAYNLIWFHLVPLPLAGDPPKPSAQNASLNAGSSTSQNSVEYRLGAPVEILCHIDDAKRAVIQITDIMRKYVQEFMAFRDTLQDVRARAVEVI